VNFSQPVWRYILLCPLKNTFTSHWQKPQPASHSYSAAGSLPKMNSVNLSDNYAEWVAIENDDEFELPLPLERRRCRRRRRPCMPYCSSMATAATSASTLPAMEWPSTLEIVVARVGEKGARICL
jgi:hypothetical protein